MTEAVLYKENGKAANILFAALLSFTGSVTGVVVKTVLLVFAVVYTAMAADECNIPSSKVGVRYEQTVRDAGGKVIVRQRMALWRNGDRVMHVYPDRGLAEQWERSGKGRLHLVSWFDEDSHGIEYMPEDIGPLSSPGRWTEKWQLVSDKAMQEMDSRSVTGQGCDIKRRLVRNSPDRQVMLEWNINLQLPMRYRVRTKDGDMTWVSKEIISDPEKVQQAFDRRAAYKTTDYIDIGDNESDPFLRKMIHLGFASHDASGFYDADGHMLEESHSH